LKASADDGIALAAALVPRCRDAREAMGKHFAVRFRAALGDHGTTDVAEHTDGEVQETNSHEPTEELS
jgi:hypothetical protein